MLFITNLITTLHRSNIYLKFFCFLLDQRLFVLLHICATLLSSFVISYIQSLYIKNSMQTSKYLREECEWFLNKKKGCLTALDLLYRSHSDTYIQKRSYQISSVTYSFFFFNY
jgi:hypothetical protein